MNIFKRDMLLSREIIFHYVRYFQCFSSSIIARHDDYLLILHRSKHFIFALSRHHASPLHFSPTQCALYRILYSIFHLFLLMVLRRHFCSFHNTANNLLYKPIQVFIIEDWMRCRFSFLDEVQALLVAFFWYKIFLYDLIRPRQLYRYRFEKGFDETLHRFITRCLEIWLMMSHFLAITLLFWVIWGITDEFLWFYGHTAA